MGRQKFSSRRKRGKQRNNSSAQGSPNVRPAQSSRSFLLLRNARLYMIVTSVLMISIGIVLRAYGKIPSPLVEIAGGYAALISIAASLWEQLKPLMAKLWREANQIPVIIVSCATALTLTLLALGYFPPSNNTTPGPQPLSAASPWAPLVREQAPSCDQERGVVWSPPSPGTSLACQASELVMQQVSPARYAEVDLLKMGNNDHVDGPFQAQVKIRFLSYISNLWAGICVQIGSEKYTFAMDALGEWQLQHTAISGTIQPLGQGGQVIIQEGEAVTMNLRFEENTLYGSIDDALVSSYGVDSVADPRSRLIGLRVEQVSAGTPVSIFYSNFELDTWRGE